MTGSQLPSAEPVRRVAVVVARQARAGRRRPGPAGVARARSRRARSSRTAPRTPTSSSCWAATARCCGRSSATWAPASRSSASTSAASASSRRWMGRTSRQASRACSPASTPCSSWQRSTSRPAASRPSPLTTSWSTSAVARPHGRARLADRRRGPRLGGVRRRHLRDAHRLHGVQPLERRAGARLGARRDGRDLRRAALAPCALARRPAQSCRSSSGTRRSMST